MNESANRCCQCHLIHRDIPQNHDVVQTCVACGRIYKEVWTEPGYHKTFVFYKRGKISPGRHAASRIRRPLVWQKVREDGMNAIYFPCGHCGKIHKVFASEVSLEGFISEWDERHKGGHPLYPCINCTHCNGHFWPYFDDFEPIGGAR
jgi:hypothetical protein